MKKSLFLLMFSIISLSIYSQIVQISQFWDIHHKFLRYQYNVLKSTNEKHGMYREWSLNGNLIISCNYSKNELNGIFNEYFDIPNMVLRHYSNYKNGKLDGIDKVWNYECTSDNQILTYEELVSKGLKPKLYVSEITEYKNGIKTDNFVKFNSSGDTLEYSSRINIDEKNYKIIWRNDVEKTETKYRKTNDKPLYDLEICKTQWKKDFNHGWYICFNKDADKGILYILKYYENGNKQLEVSNASDYIGFKEIMYYENGNIKSIKDFKKGDDECFLSTLYDENGSIVSKTYNPRYKQ